MNPEWFYWFCHEFVGEGKKLPSIHGRYASMVVRRLVEPTGSIGNVENLGNLPDQTPSTHTHSLVLFKYEWEIPNQFQISFIHLLLLSACCVSVWVWTEIFGTIIELFTVCFERVYKCTTAINSIMWHHWHESRENFSGSSPFLLIIITQPKSIHHTILWTSLVSPFLPPNNLPPLLLLGNLIDHLERRVFYNFSGFFPGLVLI